MVIQRTLLQMGSGAKISRITSERNGEGFIISQAGGVGGS